MQFSNIHRLSLMAAALGLAALALPAAAAPGHDHGDQAASHDGQHQSKVGDPYLLGTDPVTGEKLGDTVVIHDHEGRELRFANEKNLETFKSDPQKYLDKVDAQIIENQLPLYPLETCAVSGQELGSMGEPLNVVVGNRLVRLCCAGCKGQVEQKREEIFAKLDAATIEQQKADYPLERCLVTGEPLEAMGQPIEYVAGNRLLMFCCEACVGMFEKQPAKHLEKLDAARDGKAGDAGDAGDDHANHNHNH